MNSQKSLTEISGLFKCSKVYLVASHIEAFECDSSGNVTVYTVGGQSYYTGLDIDKFIHLYREAIEGLYRSGKNVRLMSGLQ